MPDQENMQEAAAAVTVKPMVNLTGKAVKITAGDWEGSAGEVIGYDLDGFALVQISGVHHGKPVHDIFRIPPISFEAL